MMSSRRKRRRGGPFVMVLVIAAIVAATWWLWPEPPGQPQDGPAVAADPMARAASEPRPEPNSEERPELRSEPPGAATTTRTASLAPHPGNPPEAPQAKPAAVQQPAAPKPQVAREAASAPAAAQSEPAATPPEPARPTAHDEAAALIRAGDSPAARLLLSRALRTAASPDEAARLRESLTALNDGMIFGPQVTPGDPFTRLYKIRPGDALSRVVSNEGVKTNWRFVQRVNGITDPGRLRVGQQIKLVQGPFHAEVDRADHRIDLWLGEGEDAIYVRSLPVGLGEFDSTPRGSFRVRRGGKMVNPSWTNPRTGEQYAANDPENPIGEYWIGLDGIDAHNLQEQGFGIHGTIDPDSIGQDRSMGCVRLADDDIALVYEMLTEGNSVVLIRE